MRSSTQNELLSPSHIDRNKATELVEQHIILARRVVNSFLKANPDNIIDPTELLNAAMLGLISAINRFDPDKGDNFESYARIRIRGALLDRVREEDNLSRGKRSFQIALEQAKDKLSNKLAREPSHEEICQELNLSLERFEQLLGDIQTEDLNLEEANSRQEQDLLGGKVSEVLDFEDRDPLLKLLQIENSIIIEESLKKLNPKQRLCIRLSFYEDLPLTKIASLLEVSVSRVSQIRTEALALLKMDLQKLN